MFTGLIENTGFLESREKTGNSGRLTVKSFLSNNTIALGDSIAVNGVCLTVDEKKENTLIFHTLAETLDRTNLGQILLGASLNLERAVSLKDRLGGHLVTGHIDTTSKILDISFQDNEYIIELELPKEYKKHFVEKGSVAIDGISLTVAKLLETSFAVHIIPHTWQKTALNEKEKGACLNIETDIIGKYVIRQLEFTKSNSSTLTMETLSQAGF
ncbi:MAG: riboflavin synthase [Verrucomicrobiota bacterium]|nr:riboflavin synthase [Verrucomicrobiota bacterium]